MPFKAIGFDLDDTLYSRKDFYENVFRIMQTSVIKIDVSFQQFYDKFQVYSDIEYEKFIKRDKEKDEYKNDRVIDTYKYFGKEISLDEAIIFNSLYLYFRGTIKYREGAEDLLKLLQQNNYDTFILTNGPSEDQRKKLEQLGIEEYIPKEQWYISDELNYTKPEKEIFKIVEKQLGYDGKDILYIGDDLHNDIKGAQNVGWKTILLNAHNVVEIPKDTKSTESFFDLLTIIHSKI